jgi:hypothetical protein
VNYRNQAAVDLVVHMDDSIYSDVRKINLELESNRTERAPHLAYSPDISPYDFWQFNFRKEKERTRVTDIGRNHSSNCDDLEEPHF